MIERAITRNGIYILGIKSLTMYLVIFYVFHLWRLHSVPFL